VGSVPPGGISGAIGERATVVDAEPVVIEDKRED
jgi:hypothetical protein